MKKNSSKRHLFFLDRHLDKMGFHSYICIGKFGSIVVGSLVAIRGMGKLRVRTVMLMNYKDLQGAFLVLVEFFIL